MFNYLMSKRIKKNDWQGYRDSNPNERNQNPVCYHYIIPQLTGGSTRTRTGNSQIKSLIL